MGSSAGRFLHFFKALIFGPPGRIKKIALLNKIVFKKNVFVMSDFKEKNAIFCVSWRIQTLFRLIIKAAKKSLDIINSEENSVDILFKKMVTEYHHHWGQKEYVS